MPPSSASYSGMVHCHIVPSIGKVPLAKLAPEHVQALLASCSERLAPSSVAVVRNVLGAALGRAERHGRVRRNVARLVDPPKVPHADVQPFTAEQVRTLLAAAEGTEIGPLIITAVGTGARQGELLALRWQDIVDGNMVIRPTLTKGGELAEPKTERSRRAIALPATVQAALGRQKLLQRGQVARGEWKDLGFVFTRDDGRPMSADMVRDRYQAVVTTAGLPPLPFHHLRHAFATLQIEAGENLASVSRMLGHNSIRATADTYGHLTPTTQRRAADRTDAILAG